jgi:hypothetical protein
VSKQASQARWLQSDQGRDYFKGPVHVERVKRWRTTHPGYRRSQLKGGTERLQDILDSQQTDNKRDATNMASHWLQDVLTSQPALLIGVIANLTGCVLQDDIANAYRRFVNLGQDILGGAKEFVAPAPCDTGKPGG